MKRIEKQMFVAARFWHNWTTHFILAVYFVAIFACMYMVDTVTIMAKELFKWIYAACLAIHVRTEVQRGPYRGLKFEDYRRNAAHFDTAY